MTQSTYLSSLKVLKNAPSTCKQALSLSLKKDPLWCLNWTFLNVSRSGCHRFPRMDGYPSEDFQDTEGSLGLLVVLNLFPQLSYLVTPGENIQGAWNGIVANLWISKTKIIWKKCSYIINKEPEPFKQKHRLSLPGWRIWGEKKLKSRTSWTYIS